MLLSKNRERIKIGLQNETLVCTTSQRAEKSDQWKTTERSGTVVWPLPGSIPPGAISPYLADASTET